MKDREGGVGASLVITEPAFFEQVDDMASPSRREGSAKKRAVVSACFGEVFQKLSPKRQKIITSMIIFFHTYEKIIWAVPNSSFQGSKLQFLLRKTPDCKAPIKMSEPSVRKILFVQSEKCMYAIQKPPFSASPNLTFCYRYCQFTDIMLHPAPPTPRNGGIGR